jgi:hypothetical protein
VALTPTLSWSATNSTSYDVYGPSLYVDVGPSNFSDDFAGTGGLSGATWDTTFSIGALPWVRSSDALVATSADTTVLAIATQAMAANQWSQSTLTTYVQSAASIAAMSVFRSDRDSWIGYYAGPINQGTGFSTLIARCVDAPCTTFEHLAQNNTVTWANGDVMLNTIFGYTICVNRAPAASPTVFAQVLCATDTNTNRIASGSTGLYGYATGTTANLKVDSWSQGNMGPLFATTQAGTSFGPVNLPGLTQHFWRIVANSSCGYTEGSAISFTTQSDAVPLGPGGVRLRK